MSRRETFERQLAHMKAEFDRRLIAELEACSNGHWGLFGQNDLALENDGYLVNLKSKEAAELLALTARIDALATKLGYVERHLLCERFEYYRRFRGANDPGEDKLARQFLLEIERMH